MDPHKKLGILKSGLESDFWKVIKEELEVSLKGLESEMGKNLNGDSAVRLCAIHAATATFRDLPEMIIEQIENVMRMEEEEKKFKESQVFAGVPPTVGGDIP